MAFNLGNFAIQELILGIAEDFSGNMLYTLDQLTSASIEVSSDPQEITDKNGNVIKQIYRSKTATFTANSALISPNIMNASSGSEIKKGMQEVPKIAYVAAGNTLDVTDAIEGTVNMIGLYGNGANGKAYTYAETAAMISDNTLTAPAAGDGEPIQYVVKYMRNTDKAVKLSNSTDSFPKTVSLTFLAAIADPCSDSPRAAIVEIPSFQADPSVTISLDAESSEIEFTGSIQMNVCSCEKNLYNIYIVDEDLQITAGCSSEVVTP